MSHPADWLNDFELPSTRYTAKQLQREMKDIVSDLMEGPDQFEEEPWLFNEQDPVAWGEKVLHSRKGHPQHYWPHQVTLTRFGRRR